MLRSYQFNAGGKATCGECGKEFVKAARNQLYCSKECRAAAKRSRDAKATD